MTVNLQTEICNDVCIEPELHPITGEVLSGDTSIAQDGAHLDIMDNGFWGGWVKLLEAGVFEAYLLAEDQGS